MQQTIDAPLSISRIVSALGVSRRKLERHFREALGMTPSEADRLIRVEQAKHLLRTTDRSATRIAADTGFCDLPHMIKGVPVCGGNYSRSVPSGIDRRQARRKAAVIAN